MSAIGTLQLYDALPALYRLRDAELGYPLRALLDVVSEQARLIKSDIDGLYEDWFIETCDPWLVPYIGELVGNQPLTPVDGRYRADVAKTLHYRRRKGTLDMLTELARDITGFPAVVVPFFEHLGWHQNLEHRRAGVGWASVQSLVACDRAHSAFDRFSHTVDVRPIGKGNGWHNIRNVGVFLWRLRAFAMRGVTASRAAAPNDFGYHFSPLGNAAPLFSQGDLAVAEEFAEARVEAPIRKTAFWADLVRYWQLYGPLPAVSRPPDTVYYGGPRSFSIMRDGVLLTPAQIQCKNLQTWTRPPAGSVAVDVERGRISFAVGEEPAVGVVVHYHYGFPAELGSGPYRRERASGEASDRPDTVTDPDALDDLIRVGLEPPPPLVVTNLAAAFSAWTFGGSRPTVIQIEDSATYAMPASVTLDGRELVVQAANGQRPCVVGDLTINIPNVAAPEQLSLRLDGLLISGRITVQAAGTASRLVEISLRHCTLVPGVGLDETGMPTNQGNASITVSPGNNRVHLSISHSICGPIRMPADDGYIGLSDSILDAGSETAFAIAANNTGTTAGPVVNLEHVTVLGRMQVREIELASESILSGRVHADRRQSGCVRFSYVAPGSVAPRRYRCQPDLAAVAAIAERETINSALTDAERKQIRDAVDAALIPCFTVRRYGQPGYAQLAERCPQEIAGGAENGSEMGAYHLVLLPHRESNLRRRLDEYLPFGLQAGLIYVT
jgi:hypothetical protein